MQFKKILSSLLSTARSRYTRSSRFSLVFPRSNDKSRNSRYPSTPFDDFRFFFLLTQLLTIENLRAWLKRVNVKILYWPDLYEYKQNIV